MIDPRVDGNNEIDAEKFDVDSHRREGANPSDSEQQREAARPQLVSLEQGSQNHYDKAVLTLSGGALLLSFVVIQEYLRLRGAGGAGLVALALLCWALSASCILFSWRVRRNTPWGADGGPSAARLLGSSERVSSALKIGAGALFFVGVVFFAIYVASWPGPGGKQQPAFVAREEITRVLSLYDTIKETCPDCSAAEAQKILQVCEGSYVVPEILRQACPRCTDKGIVQLNHRCMEKWNNLR